MADSVPDLSSSIRQLVSFNADSRLYDIDTPLGPNKLLIENWCSREELSSLYE